MELVRRETAPDAEARLMAAGIHPLLARLWSSRGIQQADDLDDGLQRLIAPQQLRGCDAAAALLADTLGQGGGVVVVADYDCDGATACAAAIRGLGMLGFPSPSLHYVVPDRAVHGYGLTPAIVDLALQCRPRPQVLVTVDNGIASFEGVAHARAQGLKVLVTDHHLPAVFDGEIRLPEADVIVNPNVPGCDFPSKHLAGVGVIFYTLLALRAELRRRGRFDAATQPRLDALLDLVALGTVADVVRLDDNNRRLVSQGLKRMRSGRVSPGIQALFAAAGRRIDRTSAMDLGFALGPRINAAGRLSDMTLGIECLLSDDPARAHELAAQLDRINRERRDLEAGMREQAEAMIEHVLPQETPAAIALFDPLFHEGVVGIVASRIKDRRHRPTFVFALGQDGLLKGSGRSIPGFHLRDALDLVGKRHPGLLRKFGGHAMAAGATLSPEGFDTFRQAFEQVAQEGLDVASLRRQWVSDGALPPEWFDPDVVAQLDAQVWGQAFEPPLFDAVVEVVHQRIVGGKHLKLQLKLDGHLRDGIWFGRVENLGPSAHLVYRVSVDEFNGQRRVQMMVESEVSDPQA